MTIRVTTAIGAADPGVEAATRSQGDFAGLDDGQLPGIASKNRPGTWYFRKDVNALTDPVSYWVNTDGTRDVGTEGGIPGPYVGVNCGEDRFVNLR